MDFDLPEELVALRAAVARFATEQVAPHAQEWDRLEKYPGEMVQVLGQQGFTVLGAADGREGIEVFREHADEIDCVLLDLTMPRMGGEACFEALRQIKDSVRVILSSGYNEQEITQRFVGKGLAGFIQKPYQLTALKAKIGEILAG